MRLKKGQPGFSLVELLLAFLLITVGLFPLLRALSTSLMASSASKSYSQAANLAQTKTEEIKNLNYDSISAETKSVLTNYPAFKREVQITNPQTNLKDVKVIVYWQAGTGEVSLNLETLFAK